LNNFSVKLDIQHITHYHYSEPIRYAIQSLWLTPSSGASQTVERWQVRAPAGLSAQLDGFGNTVQTYTFVGETSRSVVAAKGVIHTHAVASLSDEPQAPHPYLYLRPTALAEPHERLRAFAWPSVEQGVTIDSVLALGRRVSGAVSYKKGSTGVETTALEAFDWGTGVCQDQAHVFIACCRSVGIPARYVSGYFYAANEPELASHAWADVCIDIEQRRWVSVDVTHTCLTDERHARLAVGTDYAACPPIKGIRHGGGDEQMRVEVRIQPID
jgi:transglutaminase-like putative cysteine protease